MSNELIFRRQLTQLAEEYGLELLVFAENEMALRGYGYLLIFHIYQGSVMVFYSRLLADGTTQAWDIDRDFTETVTAEDRIGVVKPITGYDEVNAEFYVIARTLRRAWKDLLRGETAWMQDSSRIKTMKTTNFFREAFLDQVGNLLRQ